MDDVERTVSLLRRDVAATVGVAHLALVDHAASVAATLDRHDRSAKIVEDVQQALHDTFVDTAWPGCPRHPNHPLEFRDAGWWCPSEQRRVASLGELSTLAT